LSGGSPRASDPGPGPDSGFGSIPPFPILLFWKRFTIRHAVQEWIQTLFLLLILALGVGTFLSIRIANRSAVEGFQLFTESLRGPSDWILETAGSGIAMEDLGRIRTLLDPIPASLYPVIEGHLAPVPRDGELDTARNAQIRLLGLDLVQIRATAEESGFAEGDGLWELLDDPEHLLVSRRVAERWGVQAGDPVELILKGRLESFVIRGILPEFRDGTPLPRDLAVADIASLADRLGRDSVDRVEVIIPDGPLREKYIREAGERLRKGSDDGWIVRQPGSRQEEGASMTAAFRLNLTVLSLIALLVGMYLIAQTLDATVSRRRKEIATLRSLGIRPGEIYRLWLSEALLYGIAAGALGLLAGYALAFFTVEAVTTTVRALYRDTVADALILTTGDAVLAMGLGLAGSLVAAWIPARDAASTPPAQFLRLGKRIPPFPVFQHPVLGLLAMVLGAGLLFLPPWPMEAGRQIPAAGYATALLWLVGGTLVAVQGLKLAGALLHRISTRSAVLRLAGSRLRQPTSRHQLALSGFFVAIGMAAAMAYLIASFEHTVTGWLQHRLRADLFVSSVGFQGSDSDQNMPGHLLDELENTPGIRSVDRFRAVETDIRNVPTMLGGVRFDLLGTDQQLLWLKEPLDPETKPPDADAIAYANENLQRRAKLSPGEIIQITTPDGPKRLWIAGLHADYSRDNGLLLVDLPLLARWYQLSDYATASVFLENNADPGAIQQLLRRQYPGLAIRRNGELMETALFIFNQTFTVTYGLQFIGLFVALAGLSLSLLSLLRESSRELSLQRTLGMGRREIALSTAAEGTGVAVTGLLTGLVLSYALGNVLIFVINRQSFGWTLQAAWPWGDVALLSLAVLVLGFGISHATGRLFLRKWKQEAL
ncbi:MAG: FtsX-like permease family protein, partial [Oceanipulchritudo sp.]